MMSETSPTALLARGLGAVGVDVEELQHPKATLAERLGSLPRADGVVFAGWLALLLALASVDVPGEATEGWVMLAATVGMVWYIATGDGAARRVLEDTSRDQDVDVDAREVAGTVASIVEDSAGHPDEATRKASYGYDVVLVEEPEPDPTGADRVWAAVPGLSATRTTAVRVEEDVAADLEEGQPWAGTVEDVTVEVVADVCEPVQDEGGGAP